MGELGPETPRLETRIVRGPKSINAQPALLPYDRLTLQHRHFVPACRSCSCSNILVLTRSVLTFALCPTMRIPHASRATI